MTKRSVKLAWHKQMRERGCRHAHERCAHCGAHTDVRSRVIHHMQYPSGMYERDVEELMDAGICVWRCRPCHEQGHLADSLEESQRPLMGGGYCHYCGRLVYGGWDRAKTLGLDHCICRACYRAQKQRKEAEEAGQIPLF